jgi:transcriptional regulator with XRE-family HTH domain
MSRKKIDISKKILGDRLKKFRIAQSLTQKAFAKSLGTAGGYISEIESGKTTPGSNLLISLLRVFNINLRWLLTGEGEMEKEAPGPGPGPGPGGEKFYVADSGKGIYTANPTIGKIVEMLEEMDDPDLREVLRFLEKEKLFRELMEEKKAKKGG